MTDFESIITELFEQHECLRCVLSRRREKVDHDATRITIRPLMHKGKIVYQFSSRVGNLEKHENRPPAQAATLVRELLGDVFQNGHFYTTRADYMVQISAKGKWHVKKEQPTRQPEQTLHNRQRNYLIPENEPCPFLQAIGVMTETGQVRQSKYRKFRQINRFLELVNDIVPELPQDELLRIVDFGCGKSYLTFALYHLLVAIHGRDVDIIGLDRNPSVIKDCQEISQQLACRGLDFKQLDIADYQRNEPVHLAVSLHACDTATDDMLAQAIGWQANVILAVPCCQHELFQKIAAGSLSPMINHGILKERFAALATDALRASALEIKGYQTQVIEFIDMEHTAKNVLIRAVRKESEPKNIETHRQSLKQMCDLIGIEDWALSRKLPEIWHDARSKTN